MASNNTNNTLYGIPRPKKAQSTDPTPSSSSLAFTTHLSSLISQHPSNANHDQNHGRPRPSKNSKTDIFTQHNKGAQKRAAADLEDGDEHGNKALRQMHQSQREIGGVDEAVLHRSKRRMEEKVRMYEDLKRGEYLRGASDEDEDDDGQDGDDGYLRKLRRKEREGLVDFDRKWAEEEAKREDDDDKDDEANEAQIEEDGDDDNASIISYEDDLGRTRHGTRAEAAHATAQTIQDEEHQNRWRPKRPSNLIHGPTIQTQAFNPDANTASQMSYLASRRDKSPTPPEETHYDPEGEVRNRGMGFYAFSRDEGVRRRQMGELMGVRDETVREREGRRVRKGERERVRDERKRKIAELRVKRRAEMFLDGLGELEVVS